MRIEAIPSTSHVVLKISGRMDANNSPDFEKACNDWILQGARHIILDMTDLGYVSSMGLRYFVNTGKALTDQGGSLRIVGIHGLVRQLFELTRLSNVFPTFPSIESATTDL